MTTFGENLVRFRKRSDMTQEQLAEALDVSRQAVGKWEAGTAYPAAEKLPLLADLFHCSLDELLRGKGADTAEEETQGHEAPADVPAAPWDGAAQEETRWETEEPSASAAEHAAQSSAFAEYDAHKNRFSIQIASGVGLILSGIAALLFLIPRSAGMGICALLLAIAAAVVLFIVAGVAERAFWVEYPLVPNWYTAEEKQRFRKTFGVGIACSVALILVAVAVLVLLLGGGSGDGMAVNAGTETALDSVTVVEDRTGLSMIDDVTVTEGQAAAGNETKGLRSTGVFMLILAGAVAALVYLGIQYSKYQFRNESGWITRKGAAAQCKAAVKRRRERRGDDGADL